MPAMCIACDSRALSGQMRSSRLLDREIGEYDKCDVQVHSNSRAAYPGTRAVPITNVHISRVWWTTTSVSRAASGTTNWGLLYRSACQQCAL